MNKSVLVNNNLVTLTQKNYKTSGGEADIYVKGPVVYKLYHDPAHKMMPSQKIKELNEIKNPSVIVPKDTVYDKSGNPIGYTLPFKDNSDPIVKFCTKAYKTRKSVSPDMVVELVKKLQAAMSDIHAAKCLAVDFNELNILIGNPPKVDPWLIDVDSYATPTFKANAIMDSIRDRKSTVYDNAGKMHYKPTILSDWFSWAIITFWAYSNIHPFMGNHPKYKPDEKQKQMDDGISIFHDGVKIPKPFQGYEQLIPKKQLDWYKEIFLKNKRSVPPRLDVSTPLLTPTNIITITGTNDILVEEIDRWPEDIISLQQFVGVSYVVTPNGVYIENKKIDTKTPHEKCLFLPVMGNSPLLVKHKLNRATFHNIAKATTVDALTTPDILFKNGAIYTITNDSLIENTAMTINRGAVVIVSKKIENISTTSAQMFDGCVIQNLLGKKYLTIPHALGKSFSKYIPGLDKTRIVDAKCDKNVTVIIGEEGGIYSRYIIVFDRQFDKFEIRVERDVAYEPVNLAVLNNGLALLSTNNQIELFVNANKYESIDNPPFDSSMQVFSTLDGFFFINGNSYHRIKRKK